MAYKQQIVYNQTRTIDNSMQLYDLEEVTRLLNKVEHTCQHVYKIQPTDNYCFIWDVISEYISLISVMDVKYVYNICHLNEYKDVTVMLLNFTIAILQTIQEQVGSVYSNDPWEFKTALSIALASTQYRNVDKIHALLHAILDGCDDFIADNPNLFQTTNVTAMLSKADISLQDVDHLIKKLEMVLKHHDLDYIKHTVVTLPIFQDFIKLINSTQNDRLVNVINLLFSIIDFHIYNIPKRTDRYLYKYKDIISREVKYEIIMHITNMLDSAGQARLSSAMLLALNGSGQ